MSQMPGQALTRLYMKLAGSVDVLMRKTFWPISDVSAISASEATALETTIGLESPRRS